MRSNLVIDLWVLSLSFIVGTSAVLYIKYPPNKFIERFDNSEALFGPSIQADHVLVGRIYPAYPLNGCTDKIPLPSNPKESALPFICLIMRGDCSFDLKVGAAERGGYIAAIIFNDMDNSFYPMGQNSTVTINISSIMIGLDDGNTILEKYTSNISSKYFAEIIANPQRGIIFYLIPIVTCLAVFTIGLGVIYVYRCWEQRRRRRRYCLPVCDLRKIPEISFVKNSTPFETCVICLEDYKDGDKLRILPCEHAYHSKCIDPWLLKNRRVCPICKKKIRRNIRPCNSFIRGIRRITSASRDVSEARLIEDSTSCEEDSASDTEIPNSTTSLGTIHPADNPTDCTNEVPSERTLLLSSTNKSLNPNSLVLDSVGTYGSLQGNPGFASSSVIESILPQNPFENTNSDVIPKSYPVSSCLHVDMNTDVEIVKQTPNLAPSSTTTFSSSNAHDQPTSSIDQNQSTRIKVDVHVINHEFKSDEPII